RRVSPHLPPDWPTPRSAPGSRGRGRRARDRAGAVAPGRSPRSRSGWRCRSYHRLLVRGGHQIHEDRALLHEPVARLRDLVAGLDVYWIVDARDDAVLPDAAREVGEQVDARGQDETAHVLPPRLHQTPRD